MGEEVSAFNNLALASIWINKEFELNLDFSTCVTEEKNSEKKNNESIKESFSLFVCSASQDAYNIDRNQKLRFCFVPDQVEGKLAENDVKAS